MNVYALWQQSSDQGSAIVFARQAHIGQPFSPPTVVTDKPADDKSYNGFSSMALGPKGQIYVAWLDGRQPVEPAGTFGVYFAASFDNGATFSKNLRIAAAACPCCRPWIQVADDGTIYVAWRKVFDGDIRDIVVASSADSGKSFSEPVKVAADNWVLHACPDSGPSLQVKNGLLSIACTRRGAARPASAMWNRAMAGRVFPLRSWHRKTSSIRTTRYCSIPAMGAFCFSKGARMMATSPCRSSRCVLLALQSLRACSYRVLSMLPTHQLWGCRVA